MHYISLENIIFYKFTFRYRPQTKYLKDDGEEAINSMVKRSIAAVYPITNTAADTSYMFTKGVRYLKGKIRLNNY
jgi:hypothetical protein